MANKNFADIFNAESLEGFKVIGTKTGLPKAGFKNNAGKALRGGENSISEIILQKK